jgi:hypothetical protein
MTLSLIETLDLLVDILNQWIVLIIFIFGTIGNIFNLIIFTRQTFFKHSCSLYILATSINNIIMYFIGLATRILIEGFHVNIFGEYSNVYCKIRNYFVYTLFSVSNWLFVFASLDRYYSTNQSALKRQRFCSTSMALKFICLVIIVCFSIHIHVIIYYEYYSKSTLDNQISLTCTTNNLGYHIFFSFFILIFYSLLPPILMSIIGILTLKNIRQFRRQINPLVIQRLANRDINQLCKSLSVQMITLIILTIPHSCYYLYSGFTSSQHIIKTNLTVHYEKLTLNLVRLLLYINYGSSFYIQMIISKIYREEFLRIIENLKRFIQRNIFARFFFCMTN